jgi:anti-anti-sigma factor
MRAAGQRLHYVDTSDDAPPMQVASILRRRERRHSFTVTGDVDLSNADHLFEAVLPAVLSPDSDVVFVNMAGVLFFDSTGFEVLVDLGELAAACGKDLIVVKPSKAVARVIDLAGRRHDRHQAVERGRWTTYMRLVIPDEVADARVERPATS